jgi:hypothetical protein
MSDTFIDMLHLRGKCLEDAYFAKEDRRLAVNLRHSLNAEECQKLLSHSVGLTDELAKQGFAHLQTGIEVVAAMALLPLVEVAWCDGEVSPKEKTAVLKAASEMGMELDSPLYMFLQQWLDRRPSPAAIQAWRDYIQAFTEMVEPTTAATVKTNILGRAEKIARIAGGILGFGNTISTAERHCLDELANAFVTGSTSVQSRAPASQNWLFQINRAPAK